MSRRQRGFALAAAALAVLLAGCGERAPGAGEEGDPSEAVFAVERVLEIEISIDEGDWNALRHQSRHYLDVLGETCNVSPTERPYTYFPGSIAIDGEVVEEVGVRKKGFFGAVSEGKPSLKVKFTEYVDEQYFHGMKRMTLNNNIGDPSQVKQCLGYQLFAAAGVPAPRCNFATVAVNGVGLGTFTHVESIKKRFLARHFDDNDGDLFEGQLSDFRVGWVDTFQKKTNDDVPDRSAVEALLAAVEASDDALLEALSPLVDLDAFTTYWAMEVLVMHGDGYARNTNNFYVYSDPTSGKLHFIPWGIDVILEPDKTWSWEQSPPPGVAWAVGVLARRLYLHPDSREKFLARLAELLDQVWREEALLDEIDRMEALLDPHLAPHPAGERELIADSMDAVREYVKARRGELETILGAEAVAWNEPLREPWCLEPVGEVSCTFDASWGSLKGPIEAGEGSIALEVNGESFAEEGVTVVVGDDDDGAAVLRLGFAIWQREIVVELHLEEYDLDVAMPVEYEIQPGGGEVKQSEKTDAGTAGEVEGMGVFGGGVVTLDAAGYQLGDPIRGSFTASLYPHQ